MSDALSPTWLGGLLADASRRSSEVLLVLTREGVIRFANAAAHKAIGLEQLEGQALVDVVDTLSREHMNDALERAARGDPSAVDATFPRPSAIDMVVVAAETENGAFLIATGRARALAQAVEQRLGELNRRYDEKVRELASLTGKLRELATTDALTNLFNRRAFMDRAEAEWVRARRHGNPLSVVVMDIDHFKRVNDRWLHETGDEVLRLFGSILRTTVRTSDLPARLGGEEFVALLPQTGEAGAALLAERVRVRIAEQCVRSPSGDEVRVTTSAGVASTDLGCKSFAELLSAADAALYQAKARGRDCVVEASSLVPAGAATG